jgi:hypothetical protein
MRIVFSLAVSALGSCFVCAQSPSPAPSSPPAAPQQVTPAQPSNQQAPPTHIVLRIVGSQVQNPQGFRLGRIEEVLINRANGAIDYALLAPSSPSNNARVVPLPWSMLAQAWDQNRASGPAGANQVFVANITPERLANAPTLDRNRIMGADPALAAANGFFGAAVGGTGSGSGTVSGTGSGQPAVVSPTGVIAPGTVAAPGVANGNAAVGTQGQGAFAVPNGVGGFTFVSTNAIRQVPANATATNLVGTLPAVTNAPNAPGATNGIVFQPGSGPPFTPVTGTAPPANATTPPAGPSGPSAGLGPPGERSQGIPQTPVRTPAQGPVRTPQPGAAPAAAPNR